jgi:hypothetical protein
MICSRGKVRKVPSFKYNGRTLDIVYDYLYLGIKFTYNGKFSVAQKNLYDRASKAMFALLRKIRKLFLPLDVQIDLFDKTVVPILLYGSEVWCPFMSNLASKLQLRFLKIILKVGKSTPTNMVLGELGQFPISIQAKCRMLNFWYKLAYSNCSNKLSCVVYRFLFKLYESEVFKSQFLQSVHNTLNELGFGNFWQNQSTENVPRESLTSFKTLIKNRLQDQFVQNWLSEINNNELYYNYRMFKDNFEVEKYLAILPVNVAKVITKFRTLNHKLPVQKGRFTGIPRHERICRHCTSDLGDEFHYIFICPFFKNERNLFLRKYFFIRPNSIKYKELFSSHNKSTLLKLYKFIQQIMNSM